MVASARSVNASSLARKLGGAGISIAPNMFAGFASPKCGSNPIHVVQYKDSKSNS